MGAKVTFDTDARTMTVTEAPVVPAGGFIAKQTLDLQIDFYSDAKEDWETNVGGAFRGSIFPFVTAATANEPTSGGRTEPIFYRLRNDLGWRIVTFDVDHELTLLGNLVAFDPTKGLFTARAGRTVFVFFDGSETAGLTTDGVSSGVDASVSGSNVVELHRHIGLDANNPKEVRDVVPDQDFDEVTTGVFVEVRDVGGGVTRLTRIVDGHVNVPVGTLTLTGFVPTVTVV